MSGDSGRVSDEEGALSVICHPSSDFARRYARHLVLAEIGEDGQQKLGKARVLVVGAGGLGASAIGYLAAMGIGHLRMVDEDRVEMSNLQRQILYETQDIGRAKVHAAADRVHEVNPECGVETYSVRFEAHNAAALLKKCDLALDCTDNFATRFALHDACMQARIPLVSAAISGFAGQVSTFKAYLGAPHPCYRCLVAEAPPRARDCAQEGMLGALAGVVGSLQATEAVKEVLGIGASLSGRVLLYDALAGSVRSVLLSKDSQCIFCASFSAS